MAKFGMDREFFMITPDAFRAITYISKKLDTSVLGSFLSTIVDWSDEHGEVEASAAALAEALDVHRNSISKTTKQAVEYGFLEYHLRRGKRGNLYRLNPDVFCVIPRVKKGIAKITEESEDGNKMVKQKIKDRSNDKYERLLERYKGKSLLNSEVIAHKKKLRSMVSNSNSAIPLH